MDDVRGVDDADDALDRLLDDALHSRALLQREAHHARRNGRPSEWWLERPPSQPFVGMQNQGATCYLNSLLQSLFVLEDVRRAIFAFCYEPALHGSAEHCVPLQLQRLFARLQCSSQRVIATNALTASFGWTGSESYRMHDVQECCRVLFDCLTGCGITIEERLFTGHVSSSLRCLQCGHQPPHLSQPALSPRECFLLPKIHILFYRAYA